MTGLLPWQENISTEGHIFGVISGLVFSWLSKKWIITSHQFYSCRKDEEDDYNRLVMSLSIYLDIFFIQHLARLCPFQRSIIDRLLQNLLIFFVIMWNLPG
ncbi:hypothetical protein [Photorhabdus sp. SF281]|uniref:hypothetical protein n=1 Tax=Photorhabdus sp. SF281 TaxID=3459527 RepID=UPI004044F262